MRVTVLQQGRQEISSIIPAHLKTKKSKQKPVGESISSIAARFGRMSMRRRIKGGTPVVSPTGVFHWWPRSKPRTSNPNSESKSVSVTPTQLRELPISHCTSADRRLCTYESLDKSDSRTSTSPAMVQPRSSRPFPQPVWGNVRRELLQSLRRGLPEDKLRRFQSPFRNSCKAHQAY